jgi:serine/threonine protein kinase
MGNFPDLSKYGYRVTRELSQNRTGGRVTYLATNLNTYHIVVIKQFQFAKSGSTWADYDSYECEIHTLRGLDHPGIPRYLDSFQDENGFCMVQEYKHAESLAIPRSFVPNEIRQIAIAMLEILVYLQSRIPPVIHRDIKPENILLGEDLNVYLVDFGFARIGHGEVGVSSVVKGTLGFMAPEQLFNRQLTEASDLYSLGITLMCLLTATKSTEIGSLVDISYRVNFKHLNHKISPRWLRWLEKMVEPRVQDRYPNATTALAAIPDDLILPEAIFSQSTLEFIATRQDRTLNQTITIHNPIPHTLLEGTWEVISHPHDPPTLNKHPWISFHPQQFSNNQVECQIVVDTSQLMSNKTYRRQIVLCTNALPKRYHLTVQLQTAPIPIHTPKNPYGILALLLGFVIVIAWFMGWVNIVICTLLGATLKSTLGSLAGSAIGLLTATWVLSTAGAKIGRKAAAIAGILLSFTALIITSSSVGGTAETATFAVAGIGVLGGLIVGIAIGIGVENLFNQRFPAGFAMTISLLTVGIGINLGLGFLIGFSNLAVLFAVMVMGIPLLAMLLQLPLKRVKFITEYCRAEQHLIKP